MNFTIITTFGLPLLLLLPLIGVAVCWIIASGVIRKCLTSAYAAFMISLSIFLLNYPCQWTKYFFSDTLNAFFLFIFGCVTLGVSLYSIAYFRHRNDSPMQERLYDTFFFLFLFAMNGLLMSANFALLWVFIELTTLATAYLIYYQRTPEALEAAWKYIFICSIGISLAFVGMILLSIGAGDSVSLFFSDLYLHAPALQPFWLKLAFLFILVGFGTKMGLAPMHAWLPDAHSEAPSPMSAMLSATLLNGAWLGILRLDSLMVKAGLADYAHSLLIIMGLMSVAVCALYIVRVTSFKRLLAYSSVENMGLMALGLGVGGWGAIAALLHTLAHSFNKASFFLTAGNIVQHYHTDEIRKVKGLMQRDWLTGWLWLFSFAGISGFPPFALFLSEFLLILALFQNHHPWILLALLMMLVIIFVGMTRHIFRMIFGRMPKNQEPIINQFSKLSILAYLPQLCFLIILSIIGLGLPIGLFDIIQEAAKGL